MTAFLRANSQPEQSDSEKISRRYALMSAEQYFESASIGDSFATVLRQFCDSPSTRMDLKQEAPQGGAHFTSGRQTL
jgi:hypothetical protein